MKDIKLAAQEHCESIYHRIHIGNDDLWGAKKSGFEAGAKFVLDQAAIGYDKWDDKYSSQCRVFDNNSKMYAHAKQSAYMAGTLSTEKIIQTENKELAEILLEIFNAIRIVKMYSRINHDKARDYGEVVDPCFEKLTLLCKSLNIEVKL